MDEPTHRLVAIEPTHRLKLNRALEHAYALTALTQLWEESDPVQVVVEHEPDVPKDGLYFRIVNPPDDPAIALLIGDCVHCLRHALDHLAYQLAIVVNKADPPPNEESTQFPIASCKEVFDAGFTQGKKFRSKIGEIADMPPGLYDALEGLQPYHGGDNELLAVLHALDNLDKHRFPPTVAAVAHVHAFHVEEFTGNAFGWPQLGAIEHNQPIVEAPIGPEDKFEGNVDISYAVALAQDSSVAAGQLVLPLIGQIRAFIRTRVFPELEPFLESRAFKVSRP